MSKPETPRYIDLAAEPMTAQAFAPYGQVIDAPEHPLDHRPMFPMNFECDGKPVMNVIWQPRAKLSFSRLERHFGVSQTFFQLSGASSVVCVAEPTDRDDDSAIPDPSTVRAFKIDPAKGFSFWRGTWHSMDRYVLEPPGATFVILNVDPNPTQVVDFADGSSVRFQDLDVDPSPHRTTLVGSFGVEFRISV